jgi:TrmH family RNA methyltransferase
MAAALETMIRDLHRSRGRERRGLCLAEGIRLVEEAVAAKVEIKAALVGPTLDSHERGRALKAALAARTSLTETTDHQLAKLAATEHPQGVLVVLGWRGWTLDQIVINQDAVVVILDAVQDPGNVGTIARTAWGLGAAGVIALPGTAELSNPKTMRASMGAMFRLPTVSADLESVGPWVAHHHLTVVTTGSRGAPLRKARLPRPMALVLGNEGAGVQTPLGEGPRVEVAVPLAPGVESLNVAVAAGILLYGALGDR